jgi:hypothetical protein
MSMEVHVFSNERLPSIASWQKAIDADGFDLKLDPEVQFESASGFLPALLYGKQSGFECYHDPFDGLKETYHDLPYFKSCPDWKYVLSFRWGSIAHEGVSIFMAAIAYAKATGGVIYEPQEGRTATVDEARTWLQDLEKYAFGRT